MCSRGDANAAGAAAARRVTGLCYNMGLLVVLALLCLFSLAEANSKAITTSLTTKWFSAPLLLEASEFLAEDSQEKFWSFVEASQNIGSSDQHDTDRSYYDAILEAAFRFLSPLQQNLLKFCLSLRSYSASIQAFQQIAVDEPPPEGCRSFLSVHGKQTCDLDTLESLLLTAPDRSVYSSFKWAACLVPLLCHVYSELSFVLFASLFVSDILT